MDQQTLYYYRRQLLKNKNKKLFDTSGIRKMANNHPNYKPRRQEKYKREARRLPDPWQDAGVKIAGEF